MSVPVLSLIVRHPGRAPQGAVPNLSLGRNAVTRSALTAGEQSTDSRWIRDWCPPSLIERWFHKVQTDYYNNTLNFYDSVQPWHIEVAKTTGDPVILSKSRFPETCSIALCRSWISFQLFLLQQKGGRQTIPTFFFGLAFVLYNLISAFSTFSLPAFPVSNSAFVFL